MSLVTILDGDPLGMSDHELEVFIATAARALASCPPATAAGPSDPARLHAMQRLFFLTIAAQKELARRKGTILA